MSPYRYVKKEPQKSRISLKTKRKVSNTIAAVFMFSGLVMLSLVAYPMFEWQLTYMTNAPEKKLIKPTPLNLTDEINVPGKVLAKNTQEEDTDLTKASNWFPNANPQSTQNSSVTDYFLTIPKLKITDARIVVEGDDLNKSLINYKGTAIPGNYGNSVIFGHSVLPMFFDPKDYKTIFSTLPTLKVGDEIIATVDQVEYRYTVFELTTVDPTDISVLEQKYDDAYLSLVTCVPPGVSYKRLIVKSRLTPITNTILKSL